MPRRPLYPAAIYNCNTIQLIKSLATTALKTRNNYYLHLTMQYNYISSIDYINSLEFDYIETYSFQRGIAFEQTLMLLKPEYERLKVRRERRNNLSESEEVRFSELKGLLRFTQYLINDKGQFHPSCIKVCTFKNNDPEVTRLASILRTEIVETESWLCAPMYRDAIVFYNKSAEIVSVLNVCLSCNYMETKAFNHVTGDSKTYDLLKAFFLEIGHDVEID